VASLSRLIRPRLNLSSLVLCDQMLGFVFYGRHGRTSALDTTSSETCGEMGDIPCTVGLVVVLLRMHIDRLERVINMCDLDLHQPQPAQLIWALLAAQTNTKFRFSALQYILCNHKSAVNVPTVQ